MAKDQPDGFVRVRGAREHNLKNVDVDVPRDVIAVFSGVSGSGKSSLAFGTIFAEAQRRYLESVSPYARRLIEQVGAPDVDSIDGLPPAVALRQQRGTPGMRSSVGSLTGISNHLRMLYSRAGLYPPSQSMLYAEDFSPNTPQGACPRCQGQGHTYDATEETMVPDPGLTIRQRAIAAWPAAWHGQNLRDILVTLGHDVDRPWKDLPKKVRDWILYTDETPTVPVYAGFTPKETRAAVRSKMEPSYMGTFISARNYLLQTFAKTQSPLMKKRVAQYLVSGLCPACGGRRIKAEALSVTFAGHDIGALSHMPLADVADVLRPAAQGRFEGMDAGRRVTREASRRDRASRVARGDASHAAAFDVRLTPHLSEEKRIAAQRLAGEILMRIDTLVSLGLGYLSLDRSTPTLSPGELQRLRLATQLASQLFGVIYVLDEPSAGLHPADGEALLAALRRLKAGGNSVYLVEHHLALMREADWIVDVGPAGGEQGGKVLYSGPPEGLAHIAQSQTRRYLFGQADPPAPREPREARGWLRLHGVTRNNLRSVDAAFPLACFTAVTGVSGSGKSSLVSQVLLELLAGHLGMVLEGAEAEDGDTGRPRRHAPIGKISGDLQRVRRVVQVDQQPIGRTPRSNLATYTGLFDAVRKLFAATPQARRRRYSAGRFSFNVPQGRCETCEGEGFVSVELLFMPSVYAPCPDCHGARYNPQTLEITWNDHSIADVLRMTVDEAAGVFAAEAAVARPLEVLREIGLGYLRLGQPATELSGGEAQRIKLASELQRAHRGETLYVLDEPATGLHAADVDRLLAQLWRLVDEGNTVVVVEHDMRVVAQADWVIDLGPGAGDAGGRIVAAGTPQEVARHTRSRTAHYLKAQLRTHAARDLPGV